MRILYIHQYFKTPQEPGGTRSYWIAKELVARGHEVVILTTRTSGGTGDVDVVNIDGIKVVYFNIAYNQSMTIMQRLKSFASFMLQATKYGWSVKNLDLLIATSTPLTVGVPALLLKWFKKKPYIFEVRDLWPEVPIQMGALSNRFLQFLARWFEKTIYRNAEHVIALSPGMQDGVARYIPIERTSMIPNMAKIEEFWPREKNISLMKTLGLSVDTFKVIHFGALGMANGVETIIDTARLMRDDKTVDFIFLGAGAMENTIKAICHKEGLKNVTFLARTPMKETSEIVNFCDVSLVSFKNIPILYTNSPNKLFDSLSAGKPILVNSNGWTRKLVESEKCGYYVNPNDPSDLKRKISTLKNNPVELKDMGENSRRIAVEKFDKKHLCRQFADKVESLNLKSN